MLHVNYWDNADENYSRELEANQLSARRMSIFRKRSMWTTPTPCENISFWMKIINCQKIYILHWFKVFSNAKINYKMEHLAIMRSHAFEEMDNMSTKIHCNVPSNLVDKVFLFLQACSKRTIENVIWKGCK